MSSYQLFDEIPESRACMIPVNHYLFPIPEFNGNDPQTWLSRANIYFKKNPMDTVEEWDTFEKVKYVRYFMFGPAEIWFEETFTTEPKESWESFCEKVLHHFTNPSEKNENGTCSGTVREMAKAAAKEQLNGKLCEHLHSIHETFLILEESPVLSLDKASWEDVIQMGEQVSKQTTMVGKLNTGESESHDVIEVVMMKDRAMGRARGFGFVDFANASVADTVVKERHVIDGRTVEAKKDVPRDDLQNTSSRNSGSIRGSPVNDGMTLSESMSENVELSSDEVSEKLQKLSVSVGSNKEQIQPIKRPDKGGQLAIRSIRLLVNHFPVGFDQRKTIIHYDVDIKPMSSNGSGVVKKTVRKSDLRLIKDKLFADDTRFSSLMTAYDGEKNIFSAVSLPTGQFRVDITDEDVKSGYYLFTIKFVNELHLSKLGDYLKGNISCVPRDILHGMDLVMKENPSRHRISVGRGFYSKDLKRDHDIGRGVAAYRGFQSSLKTTSQGLVLCLDYSTLAFRKPLPVIDFLKEHIPGFQVSELKKMKRPVENALRGLKVTVTHRKTKQKYTVGGLAKEDTCDVNFEYLDTGGINPPQNINLVQYFKDKWGKDTVHKNIPCLEVGKGNRSNQVPMEICVLVEGQRFNKDDLDKDRALLLKNLTLVKPWVRQDTINEMVRVKDGPCGDVSRNFTIEVDVNMTRVTGRVIGAPELKIGASRSVTVDAAKCQWNLLGKSVVDGKYLERWALIDFTDVGHFNQLHVDAFIDNLRGRCRTLGIRTEDPLVYRRTGMNELSSPNRLEKLFNNVVTEACRISPGKLQLIVCAMTKKDPDSSTGNSRVVGNIESSWELDLVTLCFRVWDPGGEISCANIRPIDRADHNLEDKVVFKREALSRFHFLRFLVHLNALQLIRVALCVKFEWSPDCTIFNLSPTPVL